MHFSRIFMFAFACLVALCAVSAAPEPKFKKLSKIVKADPNLRHIDVKAKAVTGILNKPKLLNKQVVTVPDKPKFEKTPVIVVPEKPKFGKKPSVVIPVKPKPPKKPTVGVQNKPKFPIKPIILNNLKF